MGCCDSKGAKDPCTDDSFYTLLSRDNNSLTVSTQQQSDARSDNGPLDQNNEMMRTRQHFETLILQLEHACSWKTSYDVKDSSAVEQLETKLKDLLENATDVISKLAQSGSSAEADKVVTCIQKLGNELGDNFLDAAQLYAFTREKIVFGKYLITVEQYFRPVMLSEDEDSVLKLFFFRVTEAETGEVVHRYYLEHCSFIDDEYFALVLGKDEGQTQIDIYGSFCPSYWRIKDAVLRDLKSREQSLVEQNSNLETE